MKFFIYFFCIIICASSSLHATSSTFFDYQNYNHGYCPECNCYPCKCNAPVEMPPAATPPQAPLAPPPCSNPQGSCSCGNPPPAQPAAPPCKKPDPCTPTPVNATQCGISLWYIGITIAGICAAAAIIIGNNNGHAHPS